MSEDKLTRKEFEYLVKSIQTYCFEQKLNDNYKDEEIRPYIDKEEENLHIILEKIESYNFSKEQ